MTSVSWQNSISLCPGSLCTPRPNLPVTPGVSFLLLLFVCISFIYLFFNINLFILIGVNYFQYCIGFAIHQHESATGIHVFQETQMYRTVFWTPGVS